MRVLIILFIASSSYFFHIISQPSVFKVVSLKPLNYVEIAKIISTTAKARKNGGFFKSKPKKHKKFFGLGGKQGFFSSSGVTNSVFNRDLFFSHVNDSIFNGRLDDMQRFGTESLIDWWEHELPDGADNEFTNRWHNKAFEVLPYVLATAYLESAHTMQPIDEFGGPSYWQRYQGRADLENFNHGDAVKYHGRGVVQITGARNYRLMRDIIWQFYPDAPDLLEEPEAAKQPEYSALIAFYGMIMGTFTGVSMQNYVGHGYTDFINARRVVNGVDQASKIASYAERFNTALKIAREL